MKISTFKKQDRETQEQTYRSFVAKNGESHRKAAYMRYHLNKRG